VSYESLLSPGFHDIEEAELENHFLSHFPNSKTRPKLVLALKHYLNSMRALGVDFEVWLDGSFTTTKLDPNDIDLVAFASPDEINKLPDPKKQLLTSLFDRRSVKHSLSLDVLFATDTDPNLRSYWRGWYGFDREENAKGIARLVVKP